MSRARLSKPSSILPTCQARRVPRPAWRAPVLYIVVREGFVISISRALNMSANSDSRNLSGFADELPNVGLRGWPRLGRGWAVVAYRPSPPQCVRKNLRVPATVGTLIVHDGVAES